MYSIFHFFIFIFYFFCFCFPFWTFACICLSCLSWKTVIYFWNTLQGYFAYLTFFLLIVYLDQTVKAHLWFICMSFMFQFFLELMKVPRVESKLRVFSFKIQFGSQVWWYLHWLSDFERFIDLLWTSKLALAVLLFYLFCRFQILEKVWTL